MPTRRRTPTSIETAVLIRSRRRCCVCFGLSRDAGIKQGQLAHIDHDPSNHALRNLAFLCLPHHDQYDSRTSQSKNLTPDELSVLRDELEAHINEAWRASVSFGFPAQRLAGHYVFEEGLATAELDIVAFGPDRVHVTGFATWGAPESGAHTGDIAFDATVEDNAVAFSEPESTFRLNIAFAGDSLTVVERGLSMNCGMNVTFAGVYRRAT